MQVAILKKKLHRACATHADLDYEGAYAISAEAGSRAIPVQAA